MRIMNPEDLPVVRKKKKKKLEEYEIEEEGTHPIHERYTKEGVVKEG